MSNGLENAGYPYPNAYVQASVVLLSSCVARSNHASIKFSIFMFHGNFSLLQSALLDRRRKKARLDFVTNCAQAHA